MPGNLSLYARDYEVYLLGARYFCTPINIIELCSGIHLSYFTVVCCLQDLLLWFVRGVDSRAQSRATTFYWSKTFLSTLLNALWIINFSNLAGENRHIPGPVWVPGTVSSSPLRWFFPQFWLVSSYVCTEYLKGTLSRYPRFSFCVTPSSLVWYPVNSIHVGLPDSQFHLLDSGSL